MLTYVDINNDINNVELSLWSCFMFMSPGREVRALHASMPGTELSDRDLSG